ncbi:16977_t:CDS:2 [Gigaspora margarita]|uniref:16977_t:CDS:1 n=1 Tax=Gigaspora margarita TaxID=4874 RepID=A0ABN7UZA3_GIGMA|nr:16977_t:CDS:2 [Gigaspora margarita]
MSIKVLQKQLYHGMILLLLEFLNNLLLQRVVVENNNELIFIFGGNNANISFTSEFDISNQRYRWFDKCWATKRRTLDIYSLELIWRLSNASNTSQNIYSYRPITLPNQIILYIGGILERDSLSSYDDTGNVSSTIYMLDVS